MPESNQPFPPIGPRIVRASPGELTIYEISEGELEAIERGGPESLLLNFAICFVPIAASFTVTLATTPIQSIHIYLAFMVITVVCCAVAVVLAGFWVRGYPSKKSIITIIRERRPPQGLPATLPPA